MRQSEVPPCGSGHMAGAASAVAKRSAVSETCDFVDLLHLFPLAADRFGQWAG